MKTAPADLAAVGLGSALGALARYGVSIGAIATLGPAFPWGTLIANGLGSVLIGVAAALILAPSRAPSPRMRLFAITGFCGGFTTFSVFSLETLMFFQVGDPARAVVYILVSLLVWMGAVWTGFKFGRVVGSGTPRNG